MEIEAMLERRPKLVEGKVPIMTTQESKKIGYKVIAASPFEVGLVKNGKGIRTWFSQSFDGKLPTMDHPKIQEAIRINEEMES